MRPSTHSRPLQRCFSRTSRELGFRSHKSTKHKSSRGIRQKGASCKRSHNNQPFLPEPFHHHKHHHRPQSTKTDPSKCHSNIKFVITLHHVSLPLTVHLDTFGVAAKKNVCEKKDKFGLSTQCHPPTHRLEYPFWWVEKSWLCENGKGNAPQ